MARVSEVRINSLTPTRLVELAQSGRIRVPLFQRSYRWRSARSSICSTVRDTNESVLCSHCLDDDCARLLVADDRSGFLARRATLVSQAIYRQADDYAEWGARDGRSIADIILGADHVA